MIPLQLRREFLLKAIGLIHAIKLIVPLQSRLARLLARIEQRLQFAIFRSPRVIPEFSRLYPDAYFIQIGSNDGEQLDPLQTAINTKNWRGIMIEPVPYVFERLHNNYGNNPRVTLENVAIASTAGQLPFYHLAKASPEDQKTLPHWYDALGSFSREVVLRHEAFIPDIKQRVVQSQVNAITFDELCLRHAVHRIDLLHTDTEGYDYEILKTINLARYRPKLVIYEHHHLNSADRADCQNYMRQHGYALFEEVLDTWCLHLSEVSSFRHYRLRQLWSEPA